MDDEAVAIGQRVRYWRLRRQLSRKQFADIVSRSTSWLDKIEKGERNLLRLPMLERVAHALAIDPSVLLNSEVAQRAEAGPDAVEVRAIKSALGHYPALVARKRRTDSVSAESVERQLSYAGHAWLSAHYATVAQAVPRLILDAQVHAAQTEDRNRVAANRSLVMAYRLACSTLLKYDATEIAWLAADRAMHTAESIDDSIALARATRSVSRAMTSTSGNCAIAFRSPGRERKNSHHGASRTAFGLDARSSFTCSTTRSNGTGYVAASASSRSLKSMAHRDGDVSGREFRSWPFR